MRGCNYQEHQPYQSIYCMLNLNETASEAELLHAYEEELARLNQMQPESEAEKILLESKLQELQLALEKAKEETLSQRVQSQYQKSKGHSVRLYSVFPMGLLGMLLHLIEDIFGVYGPVDSVLSSFCNWLDTDCCGCSLCCICDDECCFDDIYSCLCTDLLCEYPDKCTDCYNSVPAIKLADVGITAAVGAGVFLCFIKRRAEVAADRVRRRKNYARARDDLSNLKEMLLQRDELVSSFMEYYYNLSVFALDIRPFTKFMATLPGASRKFIEMTNHLEQPGSFYDEVREEFPEMEKLYNKITAVDQRIVPLAERLEANEMHHELENHESCNKYLDQALNGLRKNYKYQVAVDFLKKNT